MSFYPENFSIWCDFVEREFLKKELIDLIETGVVSGVTSNPTIFKNAIKSSSSYKGDIEKLRHLTPKEIYEALAIEDIKVAAKELFSVYENSNDGMVSIEVSPLICDDTKATIEEGKRLYKTINEPNVMIKVPATSAGYEAVSELISEGINVNITLVFSPTQTKECLRAIKEGNTKFLEKNPKKELPRVVISVFVSRFDRKLDSILEKAGLKKFKLGCMNATYIYQLIEDAKLLNTRCLFASTGVSGEDVNGDYYIKKLFYKNAINTAPMSAIKAFIDAWDAKEETPKSKEEILKYFSKVRMVGVDLDKVYSELLEDGLKQFKEAFNELIDVLTIKEKKVKQQSKKPNTIEEKMVESIKVKEFFEDSDTENIKRLKKYLSMLVKFGGSDLHIKADSPVKGRVNGEIVTVSNEIFKREDVEALAKDVLKERFSEFLRKKNLDFMFKLNEEFRFRINIFFQMDGISAAFRTIPTLLPTVQTLGLPEIIDTFATKQRGLILVTGPTGCGKSTTLSTIINLINQTSQKHIITIEDPVEFIYKDDQSIINQRAIGENALTFSDSLVSALREDPDVIMVGEMRDVETVRTAIQAAETGHLVLSTLHTTDAKETISRVISMFEGSEQEQIRRSLSSVLQAIVSQRLLRRREGGRVAAVEILIKNSRIEMLIADKREGEIKDAIEEGKIAYKSQSFNQALLDLYKTGTINYHEALRAATSAADLKLVLDNYDANVKKQADKLIDDDEIDEPIRITDKSEVIDLKDYDLS
ncbi:MAG: transaldolase [Campylobacteraceae bacterium]